MEFRWRSSAGDTLLSNGRNWQIVLLAGVLLITLAAWHGVLRGTFQYDDFLNVVRDPATTDPSEFWSRIATGFRPLLRASYFLDQRIWGMQAPGFLATNLALHLFTVSMVFALARYRLGSYLPAAAAAAIFAVQPAHAEVIAYVSGRSSGLTAALLLLGLLLYERAVRNTSRQYKDQESVIHPIQSPSVRESGSGGWRIAAFAVWICALLVKETALVFPLLLVVWEITRPRPIPGIAKRLLPFLMAVPVIAIGLFAAPRMRELLAFSLSLRTPLESLWWNAVALPETMSLWVRPWTLSIEHASPTWSALRAAAGGIFILGLGAFAVIYRRRAPHVAFAVLFALTALLPTYSVVAKLDPVTEKPLYLAWVGVAMLLGALTARHARNPVVLTLLAAAILGGTILSAKRVTVWQNPVVLWSEAVTSAPESARAWNNLGMARFTAGDLDEADRAFARALEIDPNHSQAFDARLTTRLLKETTRERAMEPQ